MLFSVMLKIRRSRDLVQWQSCSKGSGAARETCVSQRACVRQSIHILHLKGVASHPWIFPFEQSFYHVLLIQWLFFFFSEQVFVPESGSCLFTTWRAAVAAQPFDCWPPAVLALCRRCLRRSRWLPCCCVGLCEAAPAPVPSLHCLTISWSLFPSTRGRKSEALSVLRVLKPRRGRPLPLIETYHWRVALARRLLLLPLPTLGECGCSVEWWREA